MDTYASVWHMECARLFIQQIFIEFLLCIRHCSRQWGLTVNKLDYNLSPHEVYVLLLKNCGYLILFVRYYTTLYLTTYLSIHIYVYT